MLFQKQKQDSSIKLRRTIAKSSAFCSFCVFAKKTAVSLTNQGCKGCQNEALCHNSMQTIPRILHKPNSGVLCLCREKRSVLGKTWLQRQPKRSSVPQKHGITILSFVPLQRKTAVSLTNQGCKGCQNEALCLCTALEEALCTQPFRKKGQGLPKNKEKLQTAPFLPVQGRLIVLLFIVFLHYHTAVMAPKP